MFCKNCGEQIQNDDLFCPNCGQSTGTDASKPAKQKSADFSAVIKYIKSYYTNSSEFYSTIEHSEKFKVSGLFFLFIAIFASIANIVCKYSIINKIVGFVKSSAAEFLGSSSVRDLSDLFGNSRNLLGASSFINTIKSTINEFIPNTKIITTTVLSSILVVVLMVVILEVLNLTMLKKQITHEDIVLTCTTSLMPVVFTGLLAAIIFNLSLLLGILVLILGMSLIFVRMYTALTKLTNIEHNKIYLVIVIMVIVIAAVLTFAVYHQFGDFLNTTVKGLIHDLA